MDREVMVSFIKNNLSANLEDKNKTKMNKGTHADNVLWLTRFMCMTQKFKNGQVELLSRLDIFNDGCSFLQTCRKEWQTVIIDPVAPFQFRNALFNEY